MENASSVILFGRKILLNGKLEIEIVNLWKTRLIKGKR